MAQTTVLVVGAGPVGLCLTALLLRAGVSVCVVEEREQASDKSKALGVQMRSLELFEDLDLITDALVLGRKLHTMNVFVNGEAAAKIPVGETEAPHPYLLVLPQFETEGLLERAVATHGGRVERGVALIGLDQDDGGVRATVRGLDGAESVITADWVVGADGSHSTVRGLVGIPYEGKDLGRRFGFGDVDAHPDLADDQAHMFLASDGFVIWLPFPEPGLWRVIASLEGEEATQEVTSELLQTISARRTGANTPIGEAVWTTRFDVRQRRAARYREGRVFLAGDAAHCHSPIGGQGMNTGLQDAWNLAWKLAMVAKGQAGARLLDSYEAERMPVAKRLLDRTERETYGVTFTSPLAVGVRNMIAPLALSFEAVRRRAAAETGELDIHYRSSAIVQEARPSLLGAAMHRQYSDVERPSIGELRSFVGGPHAGDRAPDGSVRDGRRVCRLHELFAGPHHTVLLFDGHDPSHEGYVRLQAIKTSICERMGDGVVVVVVVPRAARPSAFEDQTVVLFDEGGPVHAVYGAQSECLYLVRPDGYVGYRCQPADSAGLFAYLDRVFSLEP
jgi:2-polyprenyl-6-methoxyphenol hydroxylase-like FAD-dependent oxidoreductase